MSDHSIISWGNAAYGGGQGIPAGGFVEQISATTCAFSALFRNRTVVIWGCEDEGGVGYNKSWIGITDVVPTDG